MTDPYFVYFLSDGEAIKIGYSNDPEDRLKAIQSASPRDIFMLGYFAGAPGDELALHRYFADFRMRGEWFTPDDEIHALIEHLKKTKCSVADAIQHSRASEAGVLPPGKALVIPRDAKKFHDWAYYACCPWPGDLQVKAAHAWNGLQKGDETLFDAFVVAHGEWLVSANH